MWIIMFEPGGIPPKGELSLWCWCDEPTTRVAGFYADWHRAKRFWSRELAEMEAFKIALRNPEYIGALTVEDFPCG